eukprot:9418087-Pyramimonas_sp.AAC.1
MTQAACVNATKDSASWPQRELRRRLQWHRPHASTSPRTAFRGPMGSSTEGSSGTGRMRQRHPGQRAVAP